MKMKRLTLLLIVSFTYLSHLNAQQNDDSTLIKRYWRDSLDYIPFSQAYVIDSIHPEKDYTRWELNTWTFDGFRRRDQHPKVKEEIADSIVLIKAKTGFFTICPPGGCYWYMAAKKKKTIIPITDLTAMDEFIGVLNNQFDAYLWLTSHQLGDSRFVPLMTGAKIQWKLTNDGYLIRFPMRISDCPVTQGEVTFLVGFNKKVVLIKTKVLEVSEGCI